MKIKLKKKTVGYLYSYSIKLTLETELVLQSVQYT